MDRNISPDIWGSSAWIYLHYVTLSYPDNPTDKERHNMHNFFSMVKETLPCDKCRQNFNNHLRNNPLTENVLSTRYNLVNWLLNMHNEVNVSMGKSTMSYDDLINMYLKGGNPNNKKTELETYCGYGMTSRGCIIITVIILLIIMLVLIIKIKNCNT